MPKPFENVGANLLTRKAGGKSSRRRVTAIMFDGERTENDYFVGWGRKLGTIGVVISPIFVKSGGNASKAVKECYKKIRSDGPFDEVWCVCDVDDTTARDLTAAISFAAKHNINLVLSERCFEIWLALHWTKISTAFVKNEKEAVSLVAAHNINYTEKSKYLGFEGVFIRSRIACSNAAWLEEQGTKNPSTQVHTLVEKLMHLYESRTNNHNFFANHEKQILKT